MTSRLQVKKEKKKLCGKQFSKEVYVIEKHVEQKMNNMHCECKNNNRQIKYGMPELS
jgi:hypothetical protein